MDHTETPDTMTNQKSYKTDEFGSPNDRDYHYRIPLNNNRAMRLASWALNGMVHYQDRFVVEWEEYSGDTLSYMGIQTRDSKGHLKGLEEFAHSPKWQNLNSPMSDISEYRQNPSGSGTMIKGSFRVDPTSFNGIQHLKFQTVVELTPTEFEKAFENMGETWTTKVQNAIKWAKQDSMKHTREQIAKQQRDCDHEHAVIEDGFIGETRKSDGYCEDCGAEITKDKELAY